MGRVLQTLEQLLRLLDRLFFHSRHAKRRAVVGLALLASPALLRWLLAMWRRRGGVQLLFRQTVFNKVVTDACPSLQTYSPTPWMLNGHMQTVVGMALRRHPRPDLDYTRVPLPLRDGGVLQLDVMAPEPGAVADWATSAAAGAPSSPVPAPVPAADVASPNVESTPTVAPPKTPQTPPTFQRSAAAASRAGGASADGNDSDSGSDGSPAAGAPPATALAGAIDPAAPTLIILHGLTGGSHETYVKWAIVACRKAGIQCIVMNARGCGGSELATPKCFSAAQTEDIRSTTYAVRRLLAPSTHLFLAGYSLGAGIMTKFVGEEGSKLLGVVTGAVSFGASYDLVRSTKSMESPGHLLTYNRKLASNLRSFFKSHAHIDGLAATVDVDRALGARTVRDFDAAVIVPMFGYEDVFHYYRDASSARLLDDVAVPLLMVSAADDPICDVRGLPSRKVKHNPNLIACVTEEGGHLMWCTGWWPSTASWCDDVLVEFCTAAGEAASRAGNRTAVHQLGKVTLARSPPSKCP